MSGLPTALSRRVLVIAATTVAALATAAVALAHAVAFPDPAGDSRSAPDVTQVRFDGDGSTVNIFADVPGRPALLEGDVIVVFLDVDQNPDTGSGFYGSEYLVQFDSSGGLSLRRFAGNFFQPAASAASLQASYANGVFTLSFLAAELGVQGGLNVLVVAGANNDVDFAPDRQLFNYQLLPDTQPPALGPDTRAPAVFAEAAKGRHGKLVKLRFSVFETRGETREVITILKKGQVVRRVPLRFGEVSPFYTYFVQIRLGVKWRGKFLFCVQAFDRAGNKSKRSCAPLTVS